MTDSLEFGMPVNPKLAEKVSDTATSAPSLASQAELLILEETKCVRCEKYGHLSRKCPERTCPICKRSAANGGDHRTSECPYKEQKKLDRKNKPGPKKHKTKAALERQVISGFEPYYADPPITPAEYEDEMTNLYSKGLYIATRIEAAIQKYRSRRRMDSLRSNFFDAYLRLGGITTSPSMFGSINQASMVDMTAEEIFNAQATDFISEDVLASDLDRATLQERLKRNEDVWIVDFAAIVSAFLSYHVPFGMCISSSSEQLIAANLILNFLNYLLLHNVAQECTEDILAARKICEKALVEIPARLRVSALLPGRFNKACSALYGGSNHLSFDDADALQDPDDDFAGIQSGLKYKDAFNTVKLAMVGMNTMKSPSDLELAKKGYHVVDMKVCSAEVAAINLISGSQLDLYQNARRKIGRETDELLGIAKLQAWSMPSLETENTDETDDEDEEPFNPTACGKATGDTWDIWLEESILQSLFVGLKLEATFRKLNNGVWYLDNVLNTHVSFYTYLPLNSRLAKRNKYAREIEVLEKEMGQLGGGSDENDGEERKVEPSDEELRRRAEERAEQFRVVNENLEVVGEEEAALPSRGRY